MVSFGAHCPNTCSHIPQELKDFERPRNLWVPQGGADGARVNRLLTLSLSCRQALGVDPIWGSEKHPLKQEAHQSSVHRKRNQNLSRPRHMEKQQGYCTSSKFIGFAHSLHLRGVQCGVQPPQAALLAADAARRAQRSPPRTPSSRGSRSTSSRGGGAWEDEEKRGNETCKRLIMATFRDILGFSLDEVLRNFMMLCGDVAEQAMWRREHCRKRPYTNLHSFKTSLSLSLPLSLSVSLSVSLYVSRGSKVGRRCVLADIPPSVLMEGGCRSKSSPVRKDSLLQSPSRHSYPLP